MRKVIFATITILLIAGAVVWAQSGTTVEEQTRGEPSWARLVSVVNWPASQTVDGTVDVGNLPPVQDVSGSVEVTNLPAVQQVTGSVEVANLPAGPPRIEFVGVTTQTLQGDAGKVALNQACYAEFPESRMAYSDEYANTINPPPVGTGAWIQFRPVFILTPRTLVDSAGAFLYDSTGTEEYRFACYNWTIPSAHGATVQPSGAMAVDWCGTARPVACAAPVE